ncbi:RlmE family RNA methyltransferase [Syntrophobacter fumaroxidans]|uniref:Ribosomal RNA large subunit methyltransferase E n=1 Tax=Syntrophobacter fumaroxidans (strain DSM 10017 / MPOB) TaxID=335543 RepID=RLME_SYNFM|nr:RlmE family RNA methyltransferase [Syntrophobacter fumaroxidans]A0LGZ0.1 RecName: Full=Ribosomal RNA large subunit methyltransferase E; AltName: Full=23S rRNA Um2552 methyltransferase; AltName: Full=rRNA (uridine-2'-O-)-methyltransferase [Syntrophobacter fumaroxidans MPOB]ABK16692.1 ribosomal RNA methyltransferase RrmJ/FtsJ [Syntrophobacter fumaroxidans MPOB]
MSYTVRDHYFHKAKKEHYLARAVYKLQEIQDRYKILKPGNRVLDLGAAPGSWMQFAREIVGPSGLVVGVDLKGVEHRFPEGVVVLQGDVTDPELARSLSVEHGPFDVVLSDMAPSTSGIRVADSARSALLFESALEMARSALRPGGHFVAKLFQGAEFHVLLQAVKRDFEWVKVTKPDASRKQSKEIYVIGMRLRKS